MKIFINGTNFHHKNKFFIIYWINKFHTRVYNIIDADIIYSPYLFIDITKFPNKKFIFGPHFSVFPNNIVSKFNNIYNNAIYIQPSQPSVDTWQNEFHFNNIPMKAIPFGVNTELFKPSINNNKKHVLVYYKMRDPNELKLLLDFLSHKNINFILIDYNKKYQENYFIDILNNTKYCIWLGRHESQGFALQEILSFNIPILVWGVKLRNQEYPYKNEYINVKSTVSTVPYWNNSCGEIFFNFHDIEPIFYKFINNLNIYKPREFILNNLSLDYCCKLWNDFILSL